MASKSKSKHKHSRSSTKPEHGSREIVPTAGTATAEDERSLLARLALAAGGLTSEALGLAARTAEVPVSAARKLILGADQISLLKPERLDLMRDTGLYLRDMRQVAGLTVDELSAAIKLRDQSLLEAVEAGSATLSYELIVRLASLLARHDPVPFMIRLMRTYKPELWNTLDDWGIGKLPIQFERERRFINIYRRHDAARKLSDEGYAKVLEFTRGAFEMALHFVAEQEQVDDQILPVEVPKNEPDAPD
jgi:transcriptional regulator with XRE-family HTH domain